MTDRTESSALFYRACARSGELVGKASVERNYNTKRTVVVNEFIALDVDMAPVTQVVTVGTVCSICIIVISIYIRQPEDDLQRRLTDVLQGLIAVEKQHVTHTPKVAVGYGACHDLINGHDFLSYDESVGIPQHFDYINSIEELKKSYAYYFRHGAAVE